MSTPTFVQKDREYLLACLERFTARYNECDFVGMPYAADYGGFYYSEKFCQLLRDLDLDVPATYTYVTDKTRSHPTIVCFGQIINDSNKKQLTLGAPQCNIRFAYFDKKFVDNGALEYFEYDGREHYKISKSKYIYQVIRKQLRDDDNSKDLGEFVRQEMAREPREHTNECTSLLTPEELTRCRQILNSF